jgi:hypothetical protein
MHLDKKFLQRALLAFTTGLFLACAARVSAVNAATVSGSVGSASSVTKTLAAEPTDMTE